MGKAFWASKIFGMTQIFILIFFAGLLYFVWKRKKMHGYDAYGDPNLRVGGWRNERNNFSNQGAGQALGKKGGSQNSSPNSEPPPQVTSAFPTWDVSTPPHTILGVSAQADAKEIEAAYKRLLKQYHPDRFAHWGGAYQKRAHYVVTALQKAKDDLLKRKK